MILIESFTLSGSSKKIRNNLPLQIILTIREISFIIIIMIVKDATPQGYNLKKDSLFV